jgi:peptidoglycan/xylan/chitin deacetylase (PgdA/CDA1 family)
MFCGRVRVNSKKEKLLVNVLANAVLFALVTAVFLVSFGGGIEDALSPPSESAVYRGNAANKNVSLMINVYGGAEYIDGMLEVLSGNGVKATFFIGGCWADKNAETLIRIANGGHEIGNHGYFHFDHKKLSYDKNREEILVCERMVETVCGAKTALFAPPSGSFNNTTLKAAASLGYKTVMWSKDTIDWRDQETGKLFSRATKNAKNGDLILMHPTAATLKILDDVIKFYTGEGYGVVTVSENIAGI